MDVELYGEEKKGLRTIKKKDVCQITSTAKTEQRSQTGFNQNKDENGKEVQE